MTMKELNLDDVALFVRVVEHSGFASAARELGVPTSTVSRAVERLESGSGVRLFHRSTRAVRPNAEGHELYASVAPAVATLRAATRSLEPATRKPKGRLRVSAPSDLSSSFIADVIVEFVERYPQVRFDFTLTNRHSNLVDEGFDIALRATARLGDSSLIARKLGELQLRLYASPKYPARYGAPTSLADLEKHRCVVFRAKDLARTWTVEGAQGETDVQVRGHIGADDFSFVRSIVLVGGGIGILPHINSAKDEASGRLVRVLPGFMVEGPPSTLSIHRRGTCLRASPRSATC